MEWADDSGLGSNYALPPASGSNFHLGNYIVTTKKEVFLNPLKSGVTDSNWAVFDLVWSQEEKDPSVFLPGSLGMQIYYPAREGPNKEP